MRALLCISALSLMSLLFPAHAAERAPGDGSGPRLGSIANPPEAVDPRTPMLRVETYVDLPANVFLPGKADPSEWMATSTIAYYTLDGYNYQHGYDPMAQSYDLVVAGLAVDPGILVQDNIGVMAAEIPSSLVDLPIERVETWFYVATHNLFPNEYVGITALEGSVAPSSGLDSFDMQRLYDDGRGFTGAAYAVEHFAAGAHAIDLGPEAVEHFETRVPREGWFGVGFAADGWDLSGSMGSTVFWQVSGGGSLPVGNRPFFRVVYNAPPEPFALLGPAEGATVSDPRPLLRWAEAVDPNADAPVLYTVRLSSDPALIQALSFDAGSSEEALPPLPLAPGPVYWEVEARDPGGATRVSERRSFTVVDATGVPDAPRNSHLIAIPNPFNPRTEIRWSWPISERVDLAVFDLRGRRVRTLASVVADGAENRSVWDGQDADGSPCASGNYMLRLRGERMQRSLRVSLVR